MTQPAGCCRPDLSRVVTIPVLRCMASQDIKTQPTTSLRHKGPFHQSSRRLSTVQPRRDTLRHSQCSPCYVVQPKLSYTTESSLCRLCSDLRRSRKMRSDYVMVRHIVGDHGE
jgi:hypothetical protein